MSTDQKHLVDVILNRATALVQLARECGIVLTIETQSLHPPAMGHYEMVATVRPVRHPAKEVLALPVKDLMWQEQAEQDNTYGYDKQLAETIFKLHFASDEHYASGQIVWGVNDTVIGILTQIDNMVADMVRKAEQTQKEPVAWGEFVDIACARIKAADDAAADRDYMLDSDDCIKVLRGQWKAPVLNDQPTKPTAIPPQRQPLTLETVYETIIHWDEGGGKHSRRELARRIVELAARQTIQQAPRYCRQTQDVVGPPLRVILLLLRGDLNRQ